MNPSGQDWGYTSFTTKKGAQHLTSEQLSSKAISEGRAVETVKTGATNKSGVPSNIGKLMNTEEFKADTVSFEFKIALQKARQEKKMTQGDLAKAVMEKQSVISDYEAGKAIPNPQIIVKLERALGCRLPRDKKKKTKKEDD